MSDTTSLYPLNVFRFQVELQKDPLPKSKDNTTVKVSAAFSECTGLEATMEPKVIKEGGRNYGAAQRAGQVSFATVILKRGMTSNQDLWDWFELVTNATYSHRRSATITMFNNSGKGVLAWKLEKALPIKFKAADLNAKGTEVGVEELHLAHEGLSLITQTNQEES